MCLRIVLVLFLFQVKNCVPDECDLTEPSTQEGNLGQAGSYPWLGVIRVHLHEGTKLRIALTGAILVKSTHAIAIANDVAKIPKKVFKHDTKAMFIPNSAKPWLCHLKDYLLHPEYEYATYNTIAIIELELGDGETMPMLPVCWPSYMHNTSNQLYALGFTDEKQLLEKVLHKVQYIDKSLCEEYYSRAGLVDHRYKPTHYQCALAESSKDCDWDNGMALASNSTGNWVLIGFSIRGPGCSAPARFIEIYQYLSWIETSTSNTEYPDYSYRKSAFGTGFIRQRNETKERMKDIPVHQFFRTGETGEDAEKGPERIVPIKWFFDAYDKEHRATLFDIERIDKDSIGITTFNKKYETVQNACSNKYNRLCYTETMKLYAGKQMGVVSYQLALMDLMVYDYTCVIIRLEPDTSTESYLSYKVTMDVDEPIDVPDKTPNMILKKYPIPKDQLLWNPDRLKSGSQPHDKLEAHYVIDKTKSWDGYRNIHLQLQFTFDGEAYMKLQIWGPEGINKNVKVSESNHSLYDEFINETSTTNSSLETTTRRDVIFSTIRTNNGWVLRKRLRIRPKFNSPQKQNVSTEPEMYEESETVLDGNDIQTDTDDDSVEVARVEEVGPWKTSRSSLARCKGFYIYLLVVYFRGCTW